MAIQIPTKQSKNGVSIMEALSFKKSWRCERSTVFELSAKSLAVWRTSSCVSESVSARGRGAGGGRRVSQYQ